MKKSYRLLIMAVVGVMSYSSISACTNFIITKGASTDGSIMVTYAADSHRRYGFLCQSIGGKHKAGRMIPIYHWESGLYLSDIPQVDSTYSTIGNMNEHSLVISETTFGGRKELRDPEGGIDYGSMIYIALQRAKTAREAIAVLVDLANTHGYVVSGESFSIADTEEAWIMEFIGKGVKLNKKGENVNKGIVWVARRIPDGYVAAHANQARITTFPLNDPANCLYAPDVISFAREAGYYTGSDADFSFSDAYAPLDFMAMRACEARVWSFFRSVNSNMDQYTDYALGHNANNRMPLWIKPDAKVSPKQVFDAMRDHYEGTPLDMTTDVGAGSFGNPYRWRGLTFEIDSVEYCNERATATQQTGFWFVSQARPNLPADMGIIWFGVDDAGTSCLTPIYCSSKRVPECFRLGNGSMIRYSATSAFWLFNRVANFAYTRYDMISKDILKVVDGWENEQLKQVNVIDAEALKMPVEQRVSFLTNYSVDTAQDMFSRWVELDQYLFIKYVDGNLKSEDANGFKDNGNNMEIPGDIKFPGYSDEWKRAVAKDNGEILRVIK